MWEILGGNDGKQLFAPLLEVLVSTSLNTRTASILPSLGRKITCQTVKCNVIVHVHKCINSDHVAQIRRTKIKMDQRAGWARFECMPYLQCFIHVTEIGFMGIALFIATSCPLTNMANSL